ncbi:DUF4442 domain-containing protein [Arthrobacter caoxuetaonis]|uniref:DUF4442 domain-containing protein n=1 Tax=Arthrobacter caoxuetaonis TaxID=2886935 RepID=A0A9X1MGC1_9MICC|nr:DUF4442 domain-containing protein [Arthrobacter caoxuetaonis]MCC3298760.1 DUF4442 domain-containing protein [Arthrobacter caoxuetaonis]USQ57491.1 DUF4442 domain-containing protein [Arthrobacter caoxuetaonis]
MKLVAAKPSVVRRSMNIWPPFAFSGIHITELPADFMSATVRLRQHWWNKNVAGVAFGGSLFAMTDPFWMMLLLRHLGTDHVIWDRAAEVEFIKPGKGEVYARFSISAQDIERIRAAAKDGSKVLEWFSVDIKDADGDVVARVRKQVYVRRKRENAAGVPASVGTATVPPSPDRAGRPGLPNG